MDEQNEMKDTDINIAIAEVRGWNFIPEHNFDGPFGLIAVPQHWDNPDDNGLEDEPPNYCADLNAMNEAEKYFDDKPSDVRSLWLDNLAICLQWPETKNAAELRFEVSYLQARSNARQRAEAFLRTIGKWKE